MVTAKAPTEDCPLATPVFPLSTLAAQVTLEGISAPSFNDILQSLVASYQGIYGSDVLLTPDTQDFQMLSTFALAISDSNNTLIAIYNGFRPAAAVGVGLSSLVKINGLSRQVPSNSTAELVIGGTVGTVIYGGVAADNLGLLWSLPSQVTIPLAGTITVTAVCQTEGAVVNAPHTITNIFTNVVGWQTVDNPTEATPGAPVETDAVLRIRQSRSTALPALTMAQSLIAGVASVKGVTRYTIYVNDTAATDANGIPSHSFSMVVEGGVDVDIAQVIERRKAPGIGTYGSTAVEVIDPAGLPVLIQFFYLDTVDIFAEYTIQALPGYVTSTGLASIQQLVDFINAQPIGEDLYYTWALSAASLINNPLFATFRITSFTIGLDPATQGTADLPMLFNQTTKAVNANIILHVTT